MRLKSACYMVGLAQLSSLMSTLRSLLVRRLWIQRAHGWQGEAYCSSGRYRDSYLPIIYELIDAVKDLLSGLLAPEIIEEYVGRAEVRAVFHIQKVGPSQVVQLPMEGASQRDGKVTRDGEELLVGKLHTLKRFKDDVREVANGYECGIAIDGYKQIAEGDIIEVHEVKEIQRSID